MNVMLTSYCNRACPYCFAKTKITPGEDLKKKQLSLKNLRVVMNFLKRSKIGHIGLIGGEPTLHPEFTKIVDILLRGKFYVMIFTNVVFSSEIVHFLQQRIGQSWGILANINDPRTYSREEWKNVNYVLGKLNQKVTLGYNISRIPFQADFIPQLINRYKLGRVVRLGVANPIVGMENEHVVLREHTRMSEYIVRFVEACERKNIGVNFDCGFTLCSFSDKQLGRLFRCGCRLGFRCSQAIDVNCDLTLWRCFPTAPLINRHLNDFKDMRQINDFYARKFIAFRRVGLISKCRSCKFRIRSQCDGGCLAHIIRTFDRSALVLES